MEQYFLIYFVPVTVFTYGTFLQTGTISVFWLSKSMYETSGELFFNEMIVEFTRKTWLSSHSLFLNLLKMQMKSLET